MHSCVVSSERQLLNLAGSAGVFPRLTCIVRALSAMGLACAVAGCLGGGGGGGGDFVGAAQVSITTQPRTLDAGDRTEVTSYISEVHEDGIALKYKYPAELKYVSDSALLIDDNVENDISPGFESTVDGDTYLVFFLSQKRFGKDRSGIVTFQLRAREEVAGKAIEVDADVDDPLVPNSSEFDKKDPLFSAEDQVDIEVRG